MVNRDLLAAKLSELDDRITRVRAHLPSSAEALNHDRDALDLIAFNLMLAVQVCVDLAGHLIADQGWPTARTLAEGFSTLNQRGVIDAPTAASLRSAVGLRNVVAHGYAGVDVERVYKAAKDGLVDLESFAQQIARWT
jgi:uncharacterized protein YutE (UPF0331/DUF86 family)